MSQCWDAFLALGRNRGPSPCVTWLGTTGRVELSGTTFLNAVSKAANYLVEGLMLDESSKVRVQLGNHWQSPVWYGAAVAAGIGVTDSHDADITVGTKDACDAFRQTPNQLIVISRDPFGMPDRDVVEPFRNASAEVRMFGDYFAPTWGIDVEDVAVTQQHEHTTWTQLVEQVDVVAAHYGITAGSRYAVSGLGNTIETLCLQVLIPVFTGGSVVLIDQPERADVTLLTEREQVAHTVRLGHGV